MSIGDVIADVERWLDAGKLDVTIDHNNLFYRMLEELRLAETTIIGLGQELSLERMKSTPIAQTEERSATDGEVEGSSPSRGTNEFLLTSFRGCYADEFDVECWCIWSTMEWANYIAEVSSIPGNDWPIKTYFGTNEYIQFNSFADYRDSIEVTRLTEAEASFLRTMFGEYYGLYIFIDPQDYY